MLPIVHNMHRNIQRRQLNRAVIAKRRRLREQNDPFSLPERQFTNLYRINMQLAHEIIDELRPHLMQPRTTRGISVERKVLTALRFYAVGSYQRCVGEECNSSVCQSSVHFIIHEVTNAIATFLAPRYVKFPQTLIEQNILKTEFMQMYGFPGTIGAIDGTHIAILKPSVDEQNFINRKGFHSINCQIICSSNLKILNIFANFGGSTHDSFIWNNSLIKLYLERINVNGETCWLLGDSGYPQTAILMTPFRNPEENSPEARYNSAHIQARNTVERCIGLLKMHFRCLLKERTCRYDPHTMCQIIKACAVLHIMCIQANIPIDQDQVPINFNNGNGNGQNEDNIQGLQVWQNIVQRYFL